MSKTKKPSGLSIERDGYKFIFSWKIASDNYGAGQNLQWRRKKYNGDWSKWNTVNISTSATSAEITLDKNDYTPYTNKYIKEIEFRVRGKRSPYTKDGKRYTPDMSSWTSASIAISKPNKPTLSASLTSSNVTAFAWNIEFNNSDSKVFSRYEYQSIRVKESNETDGSKLTWESSATGWREGSGASSTGSLSITEDTTALSNGSHTRWFRVRAVGFADASNWVYAKHVFAMPKQANILEEKSSAKQKSYGYLCEVVWKASRSSAYPIDETAVQYAKAVPVENLNPPTNPSWQDANISADTKKTDTAVFTVDGLLADDECLFVRVVTKHDSNIKYSAPHLLRLGKLANPDTPQVSVSGRTATIAVNNNSNACVYTGEQNYIKLFTVLKYKGAKFNTKGYIIAIIPSTQTSVTVTLPDQTNETAFSIGAYACVGRYFGTSITESYMTSSTIWTSATVPKSPTNIALDFNGRLDVSWDWGWADADSTEISWAYDPNAWNSTKQPESFTIDGTDTSWTIGEIEVGNTIYVRLRHISGEVFSPYSDAVSIDLTLPPQKPILLLSQGTITEGGKVTASWEYTTGDGSDQSYAELRIVNDGVVGTDIARTTTAKYITLYASDLNWTGGNSYEIILRVKSESGSYSEYSDPVSVHIKEPITATVASSNLVAVSGKDYKELRELPMTVTVTGGDVTSVTQLAIERARYYYLDRPDGDLFNGYEGETVYYMSQMGNGTFTIDNDDLIGFLDDGQLYRIVATVSDPYGQKSTASVEFRVRWSHQAIVPSATVAYSNGNALITPTAPTGTATGDFCEIYRLSVDDPELIVPFGEFGETYTDPYPTIGEYGGYRVVFKTKNGDYITSANKFAWLDIEGNFESDKAIIDFGTDRVELYYNVDVSHNWSKDFTLVKYLGGSVQGYWNPAIERDTSVSAVILNPLEPDIIEALSRLAEYPDICHIRTTDGSNFHANVDVNKSSSHDKYGMVTEYSLNITRVDPQGYDGVNLEG